MNEPPSIAAWAGPYRPGRLRCNGLGVALGLAAMYQVYTQQRPGRPKLALIANAALLLVTLGLAQALTTSKARRHHVDLAPVQDWGGGLRAALPLDWAAVPANQLPQGVVAAVEAPDEDAQGARRRVYLFRGQPESMAVPSREAVDAVEYASRLIEPTHLRQVEATDPGPVGAHPGWTAVVAAGSRQGVTLIHLGRAAVTPSSRVYGVLLEWRLPEERPSTGVFPQRGQVDLLDAICESVEFYEEVPTSDVEAEFRRAGFSFDAPGDAVCTVHEDIWLPRVLLAGGAAYDAWFLDVHLVRLYGDRTAEQLIADLGAIQLHRPDAGDEVTVTSLASDRALYALPLNWSARERPRQFLWSAPVSPGLAVMMMGRAERDAVGYLSEIATGVALSVKVDMIPTTGELDAELDAGQALLDSLYGGELERLWGSRVGVAHEFQIESEAHRLGSERITYQKESDPAGWTVRDVWDRSPGGQLLKIAEAWQVTSDGTSMVRSFKMELPGGLKGFQLLEDYHERWSDGEPMQRNMAYLRLDDKVMVQFQDEVEVVQPFASEPVLLEAAALMSQFEEGASAALSTTDRYIDHAVYWRFVAMGMQPMPGEPDGVEALCVRVRKDFDPAPVYLFYDEAETLVQISYLNGTRRVQAMDDEGMQSPDEGLFFEAN